MGKILGGHANHRGFLICDKDGRIIKSEKYEEGEAELKRMLMIFRWIRIGSILTAIISTVGTLIFSSLIIGVIGGLIILIALLNISMAIAITHRVKKIAIQVMEWHAAEHKLIYLLENKEELTLETLRQAYMISPTCGCENVMLREPSDEKLNEALRVGQEFLKTKRE